ncbi:MAG: arginine--tRNA ligase [Ramlibacter sp.]|nr:arginine--tRNA ligase [Ramlibacter sp.]
MLQAKQELLAALAAGLDQLSPGAGEKAAFELPKAAAHGDLASTAAMQLAKPLKRNPRQVAEALRDSLLATPAFGKWVDAVEIAGPGFLNIRLKAAAKQQVVREVLASGGSFGVQPSNGQRILVEFVSANPTGPLHVGHGRQAALGDAICNLYETQGWNVWREFYYNDAGVQIETLARSSRRTTASSPPAAIRKTSTASGSSRLRTCGTSRTSTCKPSPSSSTTTTSSPACTPAARWKGPCSA